MIPTTWNDEFGLPSLSYPVSCIQDYVEYIIKNHETLPNNPPIHIYINSSNSSLLFKPKDVYKLELKTFETMKLLGSTKRLIDKTKNGENVPDLEVV